jgi:hypothetical protein
MYRFKKGDKVRLVKGGIIDWESDVWWEKDGLVMDGEYIVDYVTNIATGIIIVGHRYTHHPDHFELVNKSKEYVVKLTQDEVDALVLVTGSLYGDTTYSMRVYTSYIFDYIYDTLDITSVDIFSEQPTSTFRFIDEEI